MDWITTSTILNELRQSADGPAWMRLNERFRGAIVAFAMKVGVPASDCEDVVQETLLAFSRAFRAGQYDAAKGRLSRWLFGIAYRQAQAARRREGRRMDRGVGGDSTLRDFPDETAASATWDVEWENALLRQCLEVVRSEVEPATYEAFVATVQRGQKPAEAASALGVPIKTVYNARHRILNRIRELRAGLEELGS